MSVNTDNIWPAVELTDSEDEEEITEQVASVDPLKCDTLTEEEINGAFPPLILPGGGNGSASSSEDEDVVIKKPNPYLSVSGQDVKKKYTSKLRDLHLKRNEARKLNHQEVSAEDQRNKLPKNIEARKKRAEWELQDKEARKKAEEEGVDYDRVKLLEETAEDIEIFDRRKKKKQNIDPGFSDYATAQLRQYETLTKQMKPDLEAYQHSKEKLGESAFPGAHNIMYGTSKSSEKGIDRMVADLEKQIDKRSKYHRRRQHHDEADIDYINERNMKFNQKAERYYGQYTKEIKQNLERGTAI